MIADVDECARDTAVCEVNELCENTPGSYACKCKGGYTRKDGFCVPKGRALLLVPAASERPVHVVDAEKLALVLKEPYL